MRVLPSTLALLAILGGPAGALAQATDPTAAAAAQALFDAAGERMDRGLFDEACPRLEEALRIAPSAVGAKLRLGECYEGQRRFASAWTLYVAGETAARAAGQLDRERKARERASAMEQRLSRLTVVVPPARSALPGLVVLRDGVAVGPGQWNLAIPVDGGTHTLAATAPGKARWERSIEVPAEGGALRVEVGPLVDLPPPILIPLPLPAPPAPPRSTPAWVWITGAAGIALGAAGAGFGADCVVTGDRQAKLCGPDLDHCERAPTPYDPGPDNARRARDYGLFLGFSGAGLGLLVAATVGLVSAKRAPPRATAAPWVLRGGGGLLVGGIL